MINGNNLSTKPWPVPNWLLWSFFIISFVGFLDASFLAVKFFMGEAPQCSLLSGCEIVTTSKYSTVLGIPVALLGSIYYFVVFILTAVYFDSKKNKIFDLAAWLTAAGFLASIWFVYAQLILLKAVCIYCMASSATSTLLFVFGLIYLLRLRPKNKLNLPE